MKKNILLTLMIPVIISCSFNEIEWNDRDDYFPDISDSILYNFYYGTLHNHSNFSDGVGSPLIAYQYAHEIAHLDFFGLSDHAKSLTDFEWDILKFIANSCNREGSFVTFYGFEWSHDTQGHLSVINTTDICRAKESPTDTFNELLTWLSLREGVAFFNHPGKQDTGYEFNHFESKPSTSIVGMELWTKNKNFDFYYYNDGYFSSDGNKGYYDEAIARGWKIGAAGSDDNHVGSWGTRNDYRHCVLARALTRRDIYNALKARRMFSTLDKNLQLYFALNNHVMGSVIAPSDYNILIQAADKHNDIFIRVELLKNGSVIQTWNPKSQSVYIMYPVLAVDGDSYYVRVKQQDDDEAISSPVFISGDRM